MKTTPRVLNKLMNQQSLFLCLDFGSQSVRAAIIDEMGAIVLVEHLENLNYLNPYQWQVEQTPQWFYQQSVICCQNLMTKAKADNVDLSNLKSVGITTMRNTLINLDREGIPLRNAIVWSDKRKASIIPKLPWYWRLGFSLASIVKPVNKTIKELQQSAFINYIAEHEPKVWQNTEHLLLLSAYLHYRFTNNFIDSSANIISHLPFNFKHGQWHKSNSWQFNALAVKADWLPKLVAPGAEIGQLSKGCQNDFKLPKSIPLIAMAADKACEMLGSGCYKSGQLHISLGTAVSITMLSNKFKGPKTFYPAYPYLIKGLYITEVMLPFGLALLSEFIKQNKAQLDFLSLNKLKHRSTEQLIEIYVQANNITADGLEFDMERITNITQFSNGFVGLKEHSVFQQYVAIMDAIVCGINLAIISLTKRLRQPVKDIVISGGGANSTRLLQAIVKKSQCNVLKAEAKEAGTLGVAIELAVSCGIYDNHPQAIKAMLKPSITIKQNDI
ncbi:FGGY family carbohydrate kinase [Thalassotalea psychrophila]|uniref:FGGY family carbohydrate kinase n=1 Tax=Thalassotalea psychrophila TaxID=3065647 RepID=A0ABY9TZN8_9GAMM|nr:FGGY family carbohydrate kinase [Colwelliaceae bacterium SQ149]